jgi:RNA polymerase sigma-70 factor (ECF subfamily)
MTEVHVPPTDGECIRRSLKGDRHAYRLLVERYQTGLLSYLTGRLGSIERAEEAAQETFVRAFFALNKLRKPESFFSWLYGIAHRVTKEQLRSKKKERDISDVASQATSGSAGGDDYDLRRAVASLEKSHREVILLRYYGDMSCAEVAARLGVPLGTVTKRLSRAYAELRRQLRPQNSIRKDAEVQK